MMRPKRNRYRRDPRRVGGPIHWVVVLLVLGFIMAGVVGLSAALARAYTTVFLNQDVEARAQEMVRLVEDYRVDGVVMHHNRSCKPYSGVQPVLARLLAERGIPVLMVEADMADPRQYGEENTRNRVEAFLEQLSG